MKKKTSRSTALARRKPTVTRLAKPAVKPELVQFIPDPATAHLPMVLPQTFTPETTAGGIGTKPFTPQQAAKLMAPVHDEQLDILPSGEIYFPQIEYRRRLNDVFGPGGWGLEAMGDPKQIGAKTIGQQWRLVVLGRTVATAWGEADYHESNVRTSWATALESAKSNALMRCCKDLGVASECWDRKFTERFKARHCVRVQAPDRQGEIQWLWRLETSRRFPGELQGGNGHAAKAAGASQPSRPHTPITEKQRNMLWAVMGEHNREADEVKKYLAATHKIDHSKDITQDIFDIVLTWVRSGEKA